MSKNYADKLGINESMLNKRKNKKDLSRRRGSSNNLNQSRISTISGKSVSRAIKAARSYTNIHTVKTELIDNGLYT
jgi:hypothetical protein